MKILVTGSLGVVGSWLVKELTYRGHKVIGCDLHHRESESMWHSIPDKRFATYVRCDVSEWKQVLRIFEDLGPFDFVYHAAAEFGRWNGEDFYEQLWKTNAIGTKHIIRLQERFGFGLIHFSSSEVYGDWPNVMSEDVMDKHEIKQLNDYAMSKWVNEMQILNSIAQFKTKSVIVRLFNTYGPREYYSPYRSVVCRFIYSALTGTHWTVYRGHSRSSLYLADATNTLANIVDNFKSGEVYNIANPNVHTIEELSDCVIELTGCPKELAVHFDSESLTTMHKNPSVEKSVRDLNHQADTDLKTGLKHTIQWMSHIISHT